MGRESCALYLVAEDVEVNHIQLLPSVNYSSFIYSKKMH